MLEDLSAYRDWYASLSREEQNRYAQDLGKKVDYNREEQIRTLSKKYLHKEVRGCGFCLLSAHFELIKLDMNKIARITDDYALLPGVVLHDPVNKDFGKILTPQNMTEELALYHIANNPKCLDLFARVPADLQNRLDKYLAGKGKADKEEVSRVLNIRIAGLRKAISQIEAELGEARKRVGALEKELAANTETLKSLESRQAPEAPEAPEDDKLVKEVQEFLAAGMTKDNIFEAYAMEFESKELKKADVERAYKAAKAAMKEEPTK